MIAVKISYLPSMLNHNKNAPGSESDNPPPADPLRSHLFLSFCFEPFSCCFFMFYGNAVKRTAFPTCCDSWCSRCLQLWDSALYSGIAAVTSTMKAGCSCQRHIVKWAELKVQTASFFLLWFSFFPFFMPYGRLMCQTETQKELLNIIKYGLNSNISSLF